jgi:hypothetical protein
MRHVLEAVTQPLLLHDKSDPIECLLFFLILNIKATNLDSDSTKLARSISIDPKASNDFNSSESHFNNHLNIASFDFVANFLSHQSLGSLIIIARI